MQKELKELAKPLIEYLKRNHHPHTAIVITDEQVMMVESVIGLPTGAKFIPEDSDGKQYGCQKGISKPD